MVREAVETVLRRYQAASVRSIQDWREYLCAEQAGDAKELQRLMLRRTENAVALEAARRALDEALLADHQADHQLGG